MNDPLIDLNNKIDLVKKKITTQYEEILDDRVGNMEVINVKKRFYSTVVQLRVRTTKSARRVVMKTINHHPINKAIVESENQAVVEYNILKFLYPKFQEVDKCSVPEPLLLIPEIETYLMEFVEGDTLLDLNRYDRYFALQNKFNILSEYYFYCGKWLKHFQEFTGIKTRGSEVLDGVLERCDQRLKLIEKSGDRRIPKDFRKKILGFLNNQLTLISKEKILIAGRHGDFGPWNILVGKNGITVIDFLGFRDEPLPVDLKKMLIFLEDEKNSLTSSNKRVESMKRSFLEGYGEVLPIPGAVNKICETMQRVVSICGSILNPKSHIHHYIDANLRIRKHLFWLENGSRN